MTQMNLARYRKFFVALGTAFVEGVAVWTSAPEWVIVAAAAVGAVLVYAVPNTQLQSEADPAVDPMAEPAP